MNKETHLETYRNQHGPTYAQVSQDSYHWIVRKYNNTTLYSTELFDKQTSDYAEAVKSALTWVDYYTI